MSTADTLEGFESFEFDVSGEQKRCVFFRGAGPGVLLMHELPGMSPQCVELARRISAAGYTVFLPLFFGRPGERSMANMRFCIYGTFSYWANSVDTPLLDWLRALARQIHQRCGGNGIAAIGMCLTGGFALALLVEPSLMAAITAQPARPGKGRSGWKQKIDLSPAQWSASCERAKNERIPVLGLRFSNDSRCPPERFQTLAAGFSPHFEKFEIDSSPGNPHGLPPSAHSVLTEQFRDEPEHPTRMALERVLGFLDAQLRTTA